MSSYSHSQNLARQLFELSKSHENCSINFVSSELLFTSEDQFCLVDYSKKENKNMIGKYKVESDSLILTFKPKVVTCEMRWKGKPFDSEREISIFLKKRKIIPLIFKIGECQGNYLMLTNSIKEKHNYGLRTQELEDERIAELIKSEEWGLLTKEE